MITVVVVCVVLASFLLIEGCIILCLLTERTLSKHIKYTSFSLLKVLVVVGGDSVNDNFERREPNQSLWFAHRFLRGEGLIRTIEWEPLVQLPEPPRFRHCVCVLNNMLYILGGRKYYGKLDILKSVVR